ncbi:apoptotic chromatin condensation inducer in the nucleus [Copidosoma floridanum]|uniref:apoptotic chromatin condensation inducer in the nucleus n=1 Tax=Copidosoma floridanum TaxID=29053 RepID=UPI0006C990DD|nr:apoptotic chromatin condensation inducer in the nucleus [Copidosoma floridanum]XP_014210738.1 apoptotic chromatin condensation inducer in the nucleus [Copidosoma floridanum]XP_014210739.1 apoptotic chromatin condensation inducer in the nucleus [Copidosoma floridanum]
MRRKSERNKAKGSSDTKVEKPTRRITRRRGKASPSTSPERDIAEDNVSSTPYSEDDKDSNSQFQAEGENESENLEKDVSSTGLIKTVLGGDEEDSGSVWKVARADASPGEIQKLKLCRQRNTSEASDSSTSKRKSNKWPDSGDGGSEEAESVDELVASSQMPANEQTEDPFSSHPGQDFSEEVSDYKENLPETTSANLSDDKKNIDQQADFEENPQETTSTNFAEASINEAKSSSSPAKVPVNEDSNQPTCSGDSVAELSSENLPINQTNDYQENSNQPSCFDPNASVEPTESVEANSSVNDECINTNNENTNEVIPTEQQIQTNQDTNVKDDGKEELPPKEDSTPENVSVNDEINLEIVASNNETNDTDFAENHKKSVNNEEEEEEEEGEIRDVVEKEEPSSNSISTKNSKESLTNVHNKESSQETHSSRRKHSKYHESSESGDEKRTTKAKRKDADLQNVKNSKEETKREHRKSRSFKSKGNSLSTVSEMDLLDNTIEKEDILEINEKSDDLNVTLSSKPTKVSLKRSFSNRLSTDTETKKEESTDKSTVNESNPNKENHADNEQPDQKCLTKRRRWGSTATTDVAPAFSISTDSLKAIVPGAKPVPANEVKLTKDEDDEKEQRKRRSKSSGGSESKSGAALKNEVVKKSEAKTDNHTGSRRKITLVKETPRPKSPSPPEAQATNILLIRNLVRPFTLNQIKELLARTGTIVENGFWMDRIKSKCFVQYANEDQAFETRQALHGVSWPVSNPKKLIVEYATKEDMERAWESSKEQPAPKKADILASADLWQQESWGRDERPNFNKITVIREWDLGKEDGHLQVKEKEREKKELEKKKRHRSRSPVLEVRLPAPARKFKKKEEEPPTAKLLDDLFRKTKATPCIYWLPLTNEQIAVKEEIRRQHMAEHARRLEEIRRAERGRSRGAIRRRRSPRK